MISQTKFIQVRSAGQTNKGKKKLYVKGYASTKGLYDTFKWMKNEDGTYRTFNSLFTEDCIKDIKRQVMSKTIFVDAMHDMATDIGIINVLKEKGASEDEINDVKNMLKMKKLPFAKPTECEIDEHGFMFGSETNPYFADVDDNHSRYYDATVNSIQDGYINSYSLNFDPVDSVTEKDDAGNEWTKFSKINVYGISYTSNPALETNTFVEVAMRSMMETRASKQTGDKMPEEKETGKQTEEQKTEPPKQETASESTKAQTPPSESMKGTDAVEAEVQKRVAEELKNKEVEKQKVEQATTIEGIQEQMKELRKQQEDMMKGQGGAKGKVAQEDKFADLQAPDPNQLKNTEWMGEKLKQITKDHDLYMEDRRNPNVTPGMERGKFFSGFSELVQLQADMMAHTIRTPGETDDQYRTRMNLLSRSPKDDMVIQRARNMR